MSAPAGCKLTFKTSLLQQGEGWQLLSSRELWSLWKHRTQADGEKLATSPKPYGAYAQGRVCKDLGHRGWAKDRPLLGWQQTQGGNIGTRDWKQSACEEGTTLHLMLSLNANINELILYLHLHLSLFSKSKLKFHHSMPTHKQERYFDGQSSYENEEGKLII